MWLYLECSFKKSTLTSMAQMFLCPHTTMGGFNMFHYEVFRAKEKVTCFSRSDTCKAYELWVRVKTRKNYLFNIFYVMF